MFNDKKLERDLDNPNYGQLIKLIVLANRSGTTGKWIKYFINEIKQLHNQYHRTDNFIFSSLTTYIAHLDDHIKNYLAKILYKPLKVKTYNELPSQQKKVVDNYQYTLKEIKCVSDMIQQDVRGLNEWNKINLPGLSVFLFTLNIYNLLEKIHIVFHRRYRIKLMNTYLSEFKHIRNSIAHSHIIFTDIKKQDEKLISFAEYHRVDYKDKEIDIVKQFVRQPMDIISDLLLITTILCQFLSI